MAIRFTPVPDPYPETKPATEFIGGKLVQKMNSGYLHASVQIALGSALLVWARERGYGRVGTEWDYDITPPEEQTNRLVPDIAYLSYERVGHDDDTTAQIPKVAPNVAVEILSPGQTPADMLERMRIFLAAGCELVIVIDPREEYAVLHEPAGMYRVGRNERLIHSALPGFDVELASFFEKSEPRKLT